MSWGGAEREREREGGREKEGGREREGGGEGEGEFQAGSTPSMQSLMWVLNSLIVSSWPEPKPRLGRLIN